MAEDPKAVARRTLEEILPNGDVPGLRAVMHPEVVNHEPPAGAPPGLDGMIQAMVWVKQGFSERRFEIHRVIAEGDTVVVHCTFHGRHTGQFMGLAPTDQPVAFRQVHIVRFQDGKVVEHWAVRDDLGLGRQPGYFQARAAEPFPGRIAPTGAAGTGRWHAPPTWHWAVSPGRTIPGSAASSPSTTRVTTATSRS